MTIKSFITMSLGTLSLFTAHAGAQTPIASSYKFDFGSGQVAPGFTQVLPTTLYSLENGYGLEAGATVSSPDRNKPDALRSDFLTSDQPFLFSVALPEGNYTVKVTLGDSDGPSSTSIKAESRRLMLENIQTAKGQFETRTFTVNVHTPPIAGGGVVALKPGEKGPPLSRNWDDKLTLEFNGSKPCVVALEITPAPDALQLFIAGDSTVTDQGGEPWAAWGQMLPRFFKPGVAVANYAESGLSLRSFESQRRLDKILSQLKAGDYVFIQFGHNDQKEKGGGAFTTYKDRLKSYVAPIKAKGGVPVVVSPLERRRFDRDGKVGKTLTDYADAVRQVSQEEGVPFIDLNALSLKLYEALGPEGTQKAFVFYPANTFPNQAVALADNTHFNNFGAYELARCVVEGIRAGVPDLAKRLADDAKPFDPSHPDSPEGFAVPPSPIPVRNDKPDGS